MITWVILGLLLAAETTCSKNLVSGNETGQNEIKQKIGQKKTSDDEKIHRLTCYTCVNVSDNQMCNKWAIDTPCPSGSGDFCRSLHILDSRGESVLVSKSCASNKECGPASVGCVPIDTQQICISCCDINYCNVESPTNSTNAIYSRKRRGRSKGKRRKSSKNHSGVLKSRFFNSVGLSFIASVLIAYHC